MAKIFFHNDDVTHSSMVVKFFLQFYFDMIPYQDFVPINKIVIGDQDYLDTFWLIPLNGLQNSSMFIKLSWGKLSENITSNRNSSQCFCNRTGTPLAWVKILFLWL